MDTRAALSQQLHPVTGWVGEENSLGDLQVHGEPAAALARLAPQHQCVLLTCKSLFSPISKSLGEQRCMESLKNEKKFIEIQISLVLCHLQQHWPDWGQSCSQGLAAVVHG